MRQAASAQVLAQSGYLLPQDAAVILERSREQKCRVEGTLSELKIAPPSSVRGGFDDLRGGLPNPAPPETFDGLAPELVSSLQSAFGALATTLPPESALDLIQSILNRLSDQATPPFTDASP